MKHCPKVVVFAFERVESATQIAADERRFRGFSHRHVVLGVATAGNGELASQRHTVDGERADRFQPAESRLTTRFFGDLQQVLVGQNRQGWQQVAALLAVGKYRLGSSGCKAAREDATPAENVLLLGAQQLIAGGHGRAQRSVPRRQIRYTAEDEGRPRVQTLEDGVRRQDTQLRRRELDGQWQAIQVGADFGHIAHVVGHQTKRRPARPTAIDEQSHRGVARRNERIAGVGPRHRQRFDRQDMLGTQVQRLATGDQ